MATRLRSILFPIVLAGVAAACGSGSGGLTDLSGRWLFYRVQNGVDEDPIHLTVAQAGTSVTADLTCNDDWPVGTGTFVGGALTLTFDMGGGNVLEVTGTAQGGQFAGTYAFGPEAGAWRMEATDLRLDCALACEAIAPIRFVETDFTELAKVEEISLFRSAAGHDYSDACEPCRSMKHYYAPFLAFRDNDLIEVRAPVDGTIIAVAAEGHGASPPGINKQVRIRSSLHPEYTFILFHVDLVSTAIVAGKPVTAGEMLGYARLYYPDLGSYAHDFDIAVRVATPYGARFVSFFETMTDALFATYVARGAASRSDFVIPQAARDADPLACDGETFTGTGSLASWFTLTP